MRIDEIIKVKSIESSEKNSELLDMVIAFDTTGSMSSYINNVKKHVSTLVPNLLAQNPNLKIGIVAFGDYCDMISYRADVFGAAYQFLDLTINEHELIDFITNAKNTGGGDADEFYELVIRKINTETSWREGSNKLVLLIGDSRPHGIEYEYNGLYPRIDWMEECKKAKELGIQIDTLSIVEHNSCFYEEVSKITGGVCLPFISTSNMTKVTEASALSRGGEVTKDAFYKNMAASAGDKEMEEVYNRYKNIVK